LVLSDGNPECPDHEPLEVAFLSPEETINSGRMAPPEILALRRALTF